MQIFLQVRKSEKIWILKLFMVSIQYIFQILKIFLIFLMSMWRRGFVIKDIVLRREKIMDIR